MVFGLYLKISYVQQENPQHSTSVDVVLYSQPRVSFAFLITSSAFFQDHLQCVSSLVYMVDVRKVSLLAVTTEQQMTGSL